MTNQKHYFYRFIDLVIYGNFWIAFAAMSMFMQSQLLFTNSININIYSLFLFSSTFLLYAIHRSYGIVKLNNQFNTINRFQIISSYRSHIIIYGSIAFLISLILWLQFSFELKVTLIVPILICFLYVLPIPYHKKRLRDLPFIKIFLITIIWSWVVTFFPAFVCKIAINNCDIYLLFAEKSFFLFAITLPFDVRDYNIDSRNRVATIPISIGIKRSYQLSFVLILLSTTMSIFLFNLNFYSKPVFIATCISYLISIIAIQWTKSKKNDYYYSGLLDGLMILQSLLTIIFY